MKTRKTCRALLAAAALLLGAPLSFGAEVGAEAVARSGALGGRSAQRVPGAAPSAPMSGPGWVQYGIHCAGCHGAAMRGRSASAVQDAIARYFSMRGLGSMTPAQLNAIASGQ